MDETTGIGAAIRLERRLLGLTLDELAMATEISRQSLTRYELGKTLPSRRAVQVICNALGISPARLEGNTKGQDVLGRRPLPHGRPGRPRGPAGGNEIQERLASDAG